MSEMKEFRGMKCVVVDEISLKSIKGYVVFADRERGITIHGDKNDEQIFCINKKEILDYAKNFKLRGGNRCYHDIFTYVIKSILSNGTVSHIIASPPDERDLGFYIAREYRGSGMSCAY